MTAIIGRSALVTGPYTHTSLSRSESNRGIGVSLSRSFSGPRLRSWSAAKTWQHLASNSGGRTVDFWCSFQGVSNDSDSTCRA